MLSNTGQLRIVLADVVSVPLQAIKLRTQYSSGTFFTQTTVQSVIINNGFT